MSICANVYSRKNSGSVMRVRVENLKLARVASSGQLIVIFLVIRVVE